MDRTEQTRKRRARHAERMADARRQRGDACEDCGSSDRLEWDHRDPDTKVKAVSAFDWVDDARFWAEVAKCDLLCRPCHIAKTSARGEWANKGRPPTSPHGLGGYKRRGCRCEVCCAAKAAENARRPSRAASPTGGG